MPSLALPYTTLFRSDRKSTRLNSSHSSMSYAVFCLKKKNPVLFRGQFILGQLCGVAAHDLLPSLVAVDHLDALDVHAFFFFNDTAPTEIYTLSLHDALPICSSD